MNKKFHLLVTFTYDVSLKEWADSGLIGRELVLYREMVESGNRVTLITYGDARDYEFLESLGKIELVPVFAFFQKRTNKWLNFFFSFFLPFKFRRYFKSADIIKSNQMSGSWVAAIASIIYGKQLVVRCGFEMLRNILRDEPHRGKWLIKAVFGYLAELFSFMVADRIVISSQTDREFIQSRFPVKSKIRLIRNFIDMNVFRPIENLKNFSIEKMRILFVGRLIDRKNIRNVIDAVAKINVGLDIVGAGPEKKEYQKCAEDLNADVGFLGVFPNTRLPEIINACDFFILPSYYENNPKGLLEAMACGSVVIGSDVEGIRELIQDGATGFLCNTESASIAATIKKASLLSTDQKREMGIRARTFVQKECSLENVFQKEMHIYQDIFEREGR